MKVGMQIRAVLQLDTALGIIDDLPIISAADASIVFVLPYLGMEIYCAEASDALAGALLIINERIAAKLPKVIPVGAPEDGK